jgi:hypothetical protein
MMRSLPPPSLPSSSPRALLLAASFAALALSGCVVTSTGGDGGAPDANRIPADATLPRDAGTTADTGPSCEPGEILCDGACTRVAGDSRNCGSCGNICPSGVSCAVGRCDCMLPNIACDGVCLDPTDDPENCGACGVTCGSTEACVDGACVVACDPPSAICTNRDESGNPVEVCANLQTDPINCGGCNTRCAGGSSCIAGRCGCGPDQISCGGRCANILTDASNCGSCGITCGTGGVCVDGACTTCGAGRTSCSGRCVDTMTDRFNCGSCGRPCGTGEACVGGLCECAGSLVDCGTGCTDLQTDEANCGTCGVDCGRGGVCSSGTCVCSTGLTDCSGSCRDLARDPNNCGDCGTTCGMGEACDAGTCVIATTFRVTSFSATNCRTVNHDPPSGDDRGGIAVSPTRLFITGDSATVRMSPDDLSGVASVAGSPAVHNGLFTDLETEQVYVLLDAAGAEPNGTATITQIAPLDPDTGAVSATRIPLSTPIPVAYGSGIFAGYGELLIGALGSSTLQWWHVELPAGIVTRLGTTPNPTHRTCENWAWWGVAEFFGSVRYAAYVESTTRIVRLPIPDTGMATPAPIAISSFTNLGDMCSIVFSPSRGRWYFHHEYDSQFSPSSSFGEVGGYCDGTFDRP